MLGEVQIATVRNQVLLSMFTDFENFSVFKPAPQQEKSVNAMLDQVIAWGGALKTLRDANGHIRYREDIRGRGEVAAQTVTK